MINRNIILVMLTPLVFSVCSGNKESERGAENEIKDVFLEQVAVVNATLSNREQELTLAGKVECDPEKTINYTPLLNGVIDRVYFSLGDRVQQGQQLLDIRSTEFTTLRSEKVSLETEKKIAERELQTAQSLYDDGMFSEKELFEAQGKLRQAQAALNKVNADIAVYGVQKEDGTFSVKAPIAGHIIGKNASSGTTVSEGGEPLFTIADLNSVWILVNVYAGNLQFVHEGMDVEITSLSYPGEVFRGKISYIPQVFDTEEKVLKARIVMENPQLKFKPEMSVVVKLKSKDPAKCVSIPAEALIFDKNQYFVIVQEAERQFSSKPVVLQGHNDKTAYIASGLQEDEKVVVANQLLIYSGLK